MNKASLPALADREASIRWQTKFVNGRGTGHPPFRFALRAADGKETLATQGLRPRRACRRGRL